MTVKHCLSVATQDGRVDNWEECSVKINFYQYLVLTEEELLLIFITERRVISIDVVYGEREVKSFYEMIYKGSLITDCIKIWERMGYVVEKCKL